MNNNIVPIGCVQSSDVKDTGFINFSELVKPVKNVEECIEKAEIYGNLCGDDGKTGNCTYVVYHSKDQYDFARIAAMEYKKSQEIQTEI